MALDPGHRMFTRTEYHRLAEVGILGPHERTELVAGEILLMPSIGPRHAGVVERLVHMLREAVGPTAQVRTQNPVRLDDHSEPVPDVAVVRPRDDFYDNDHPAPEDVHLLIEVADTSHIRDRNVKLPAYATAGIREYWLVDLSAERVEVFRDPGSDGYGSVTTPHTLSPLDLPDVRIDVSDILPTP